MAQIIARARYSSWIGADRPFFTHFSPHSQPQPTKLKRGPREKKKAQEEGEGVGGGGPSPSPFVVELRKMRHPLLLQQHRERLRLAKINARRKKSSAVRLRARPGAVTSGALGEAEENARAAADEVSRCRFFYFFIFYSFFFPILEA